jgi:hypothetical protein
MVLPVVVCLLVQRRRSLIVTFLVAVARLGFLAILCRVMGFSETRPDSHHMLAGYVDLTIQLWRA